MAEGPVSYLGRDLREALADGATRTPAVSPDGGRWLALWALGCALAGLTLFLFCGYHAGFWRLNGLAAETPDWIWQWVTVLGDERVAFALTLFFSRRYPRVFWSLIVAALIGIAYTHALKPLFSALRPAGVLDPDAFNLIGPRHRKVSFPSGHSVTAAVFFAVWLYYLRATWARWILVLVAVAAGLSRVAVGVHWPVDVAAGLMGGILAAWLGVALARRSPWGILEPSVHLAFVSLAAVLTVTLLYWDGGYGAAAQVQRLVGVAALVCAAYLYLIRPLSRWLGERERRSP
ncbi:MAG: phosphatase PAP2 family protein [Pseudomonadota bacterium]|nr:phosphatase PAP2 family protein [Pseudomonadota bacterium]